MYIRIYIYVYIYIYIVRAHSARPPPCLSDKLCWITVKKVTATWMFVTRCYIERRFALLNKLSWLSSLSSSRQRSKPRTSCLISRSMNEDVHRWSASLCAEVVSCSIAQPSGTLSKLVKFSSAGGVEGACHQDGIHPLQLNSGGYEDMGNLFGRLA